MTQADLTKSFRVIDTLAAEARRLFAIGEDRQAAFGNLAAIQLEAQAGMQGAQGNLSDEILACCKCGLLIYKHAIGSPYSDLWAVKWRGKLWCQECVGKALKTAQISEASKGETDERA